ncbi:uncharacterized protein LOC111697594 [Eurytemora carolleeae]|uniref:uncharacterized protein LOC111697594 n=1 Tax=Eurytemora carolleeae TaxID=1294199 RepID=UPI000C785E40|nr:uncharacterized protein LOC111697594 [Eurytemora carolleeae]|eukprot:XP_023323415.1 uncharacterized protein LOC111697594 [Eurytemora affinis]
MNFMIGHYQNSRCQSYNINTETGNGRRALQTDSGVNFFEKICLRGVRQNQFDQMCNGERGWAFERVIGSALEGFDHKEVRSIETRSECARLCLLEEEFPCRSAEFSSDSKTCILSREDRRTQPEAFKKGTKPNIDYIENQCAKQLPDCAFTQAEKDVTVVAMNDIFYSRTVQARAFNCRSLSQKDDRCYLSGDDSISLPNIPKPTEPGATYKEKACTRSTCDGGIFTFEKTTAHFLRTARQQNLQLSSNTPGITKECAQLCVDQGADCPAFSIDYNGQRCFVLDRNTQGRGDDLMPRDGTNYFEKICLRGQVSKCQGKAWAFERTPGKVLQGFDNKIVNQVPNRRDCQELCLQETGFRCRSADYNTITLSCALSTETRRTQPTSYQDSKDTEYLENTCIDTEELSCPYQRTDNAYPRYLDSIVSRVTDEIACEKQCTFHQDFVCRAFAFYTSASQCFISGDDLMSAGDGALQTRPGTDFFQRNCQDILGEPTSANKFIPETGSTQQASQTLPQERRCTFGKLEFEKTTGYELIRARPYKLYSRREGGISAECSSRCQSDSRCQGFNLDYNRNECQAVTENSEGNLFNLRPSTGIAFFEAICLRGRTCGAVWTFERYIDFELRGFVRDTHRDISKTECQDLCLSESRFICRSATYDHLRKECYLSEEDRFTQPDSLLAKQGSDYLENQCQSRQSNCDYSPQTRDQYIIYTDKSLSSFSSASCKQSCTQERDFNCRSYSFLSETRSGDPQCLLSSDTQKSAGGNAFQLATGALYAEKECGRKPRPADSGFSSSGDSFSSSGSSGLSSPGFSSGGRPSNQLLPQTLPDDTLPSYSGDGGNPANCRADGLVSAYEKIVDFTFTEGSREEIQTTVDIGIAAECIEECTDMGDRCLAVTLQNERGGRQRCFALDSSAGVEGTAPSSATGVTYFEKICASKSCGKSWSFTRVPMYEFVGVPTEEVDNVRSLSACRELCLNARSFPCRSATYNSGARICKLSEESRRTQPTSFRPAIRGIDYLENECSELPANCEYIDQPGTYLPFTDTYVPDVEDIEGCRTECNSQSNYNCRSFNYNSARQECFLSADDSISLPTGLQQDRDFTFSERAGCNNVRVECTPSDMLVTLSFGQEFNGRIYATGNPQACFELGSGQSEMSLRIPIGSQCGTVQSGRGRYVNHVVIQANPIIMQDTDKTVRVECAFTAEDQTVSFRPTAGGRDDGGGISVTVPFQPTGTNIVTNTAPTPGVRMRVVRRTGSTADVVGLGEDLQLRIEIDEDSAFGLFARNLEARTDNGELLNLIDGQGCPLNELIYPALALESKTRALFANFKAFRFPSTPTVNFVATVQFCQDLCEPVTCTGNLGSYGRRKREVGNETDTTILQASTTSTRFTRSIQETSGETNEGDETTVPASSTSKASLPVSPMKSSPAEISLPTSPTGSSLPTSPTGSSLPTSPKESSLPKNLIPELTVLGLRLTVGEDQVVRPHPPSKSGTGKFGDQTPESVSAFPDTDSYYPAFLGHELLDPSFVCSPQSTIIAIIIVVVFINTGLVVAGIFFYRMKRKSWRKVREVERSRPVDMPPPLPPHHPSRTNAVYSNLGQDVLFKTASNPRSRFMENPTLIGMTKTSNGNHR